MGTAVSYMVDYGTYTHSYRLRLRDEDNNSNVFSSANSVPAGTHIGSVIADSSGTKAWSDGTSIINVTTKHQHYDMNTEFEIGGANYHDDQEETGDRGFVGDIAEVIIYSAALNSAQRILAENYLSAKYNITIADDRYAGHDASYIRDVAGIGQESDGSHTEAHSAGLVAMSNGTLSDGDYLMFGHSTVTNSVVTSNLGSTDAVQRWERIWFLDKTGTVDRALAFDYSEGGVGGTPGVASNYRLLYRAGTSEDFSNVTTASTSKSGD